MKEVSNVSIGNDIRDVIAQTLVNRGRVVSPTELWDAVRNGEPVFSPRYGRYKSVLKELMNRLEIKLHKDEEGRPQGFEWIGKSRVH